MITYDRALRNVLSQPDYHKLRSFTARYGSPEMKYQLSIMTDESLEIAFHKMMLCKTYISDNLKSYSRKWLIEHNCSESIFTTGSIKN